MWGWLFRNTVTSLVNIPLNFKCKYYKYTVIFLLEKRLESFAVESSIFPTRNDSVFDNVVGIYLTS